VVIPELIETVHCVYAGTSAVIAVSVNVAVDVPEFEAVAEKVVEPHPLEAGDAREAIEKPGSTTAI
jgi:hypothetical protein